MPDGSPWPRLTIITPNFNREAFLEEAIRAVLLQGYPNLEYIVIDGGSTDRSVDLIRKYEPWLSHWVSEPDSGAAAAINKGLRRATGSLFGLALSDDYLYPDAIRLCAEAHHRQPDSIVAGDVIHRYEQRSTEELMRQKGLSLANVVQYWNGEYCFLTPGLFFPAGVKDAVGERDESLFCEDYDFLCRALTVAPVLYLERTVACFRIHPGSMTSGDTHDLIWLEIPRLSRRYWHLLSEVDVAGYRRWTSKLLFSAGLLRLRHRRPLWYRFMFEGLRMDPVGSLYSALGLAGLWLGKRMGNGMFSQRSAS
jgi:glycosyltransferase involved in cell wall biosynthesis